MTTKEARRIDFLLAVLGLVSTLAVGLVYGLVWGFMVTWVVLLIMIAVEN